MKRNILVKGYLLANSVRKNFFSIAILSNIKGFTLAKVYSCQVAPLLQLRQLADQYGASLHLDDAHATGVFHKKLWTTGEKNTLIAASRGKISSMISSGNRKNRPRYRRAFRDEPGRRYHHIHAEQGTRRNVGGFRCRFKGAGGGVAQDVQELRLLRCHACLQCCHCPEITGAPAK